MTAREPRKTLAEIPHSEPPGDRRAQRQTNGRAEQQPCAYESLNKRKHQRPSSRMRADHLARPAGRRGHEPRLPLAGGASRAWQTRA